MCPSEMAAYHGTAVGHIRLLRSVLFGAPTWDHLLKHRRLSFVPILCAFVFACMPGLANAQDIGPGLPIKNALNDFSGAIGG